MICLGLDDEKKLDVVHRYAAGHGITKVVVFSPERFRLRGDLAVAHEHVEWAEIIKYRFYYRLLAEVGPETLLVINECLRTQDRHDLTYNCLRNYLNQTSHQLIFQRFPLIDTIDDFAILFDLDTRSRWKRAPFAELPLAECSLTLEPRMARLQQLDVAVGAKVRQAYQAEKRRLIEGIGLKDPHTIPRNLLLFAGRAKLGAVRPDERYVGRNNRFKISNLETYDDVATRGARTVFELCHRFIDFADFLAVSGQSDVDVLVSDLKVDSWYFERFTEWTRRLAGAYTALRR